jgi:hypothetical protein
MASLEIPAHPLEGEGFKAAAACDVDSFPFKGKGRMGMGLLVQPFAGSRCRTVSLEIPASQGRDRE